MDIQSDKRKKVIETFAENCIPNAVSVGDVSEIGSVKIKIDHTGVDHTTAICIGAKVGEIPGFQKTEVVNQRVTKEVYALFDAEKLLNHIISNDH